MLSIIFQVFNQLELKYVNKMISHMHKIIQYKILLLLKYQFVNNIK